MAEISFKRDGAGKVISLTLYQNGINQDAPRSPLPLLPKEVVLPIETLREYVGTYQFNPTFALVVFLDGDRLMTQATGQPRYQVFPTAKDVFFTKEFPAAITFKRDSEGTVVGFVVRQNGSDSKAVRVTN